MKPYARMILAPSLAREGRDQAAKKKSNMTESDGGARKNIENRSAHRPILWYNIMQYKMSLLLDEIQQARDVEIWYNRQYSDR